MNVDFVNYDITGAVAIVPIILAIIQGLKLVGMPNKYSPIASIALGILVGFLFRHESTDLSQTILAGVTYGLSASGLYSGVKSTSENIKNDPPKSETERKF